MRSLPYSTPSDWIVLSSKTYACTSWQIHALSMKLARESMTKDRKISSSLPLKPKVTALKHQQKRLQKSLLFLLKNLFQLKLLLINFLNKNSSNQWQSSLVQTLEIWWIGKRLKKKWKSLRKDWIPAKCLEELKHLKCQIEWNQIRCRHQQAQTNSLVLGNPLLSKPALQLHLLLQIKSCQLDKLTN